MDIVPLLSSRARVLQPSGIRRISDLATKIPGVINLSIGQPDFTVPAPIKQAAIRAINSDRNGYAVTPGIPELRRAIATRLGEDLGWSTDAPTDPGFLVTVGTSGALLLCAQALLSPGDEMIIPDPYFTLYPELAHLCDARAVVCDTYPDFRLTAQRVEPLITPRTKLVLLTSPSNPCGVVAPERDVADLLDLCRRRGVLLVSDEIYDEFSFSESRTSREVRRPDRPRCPSAARLPGASDDVLVIRGFGKTYGVTGWRLGFAAGPRALIEQMTKINMYTFVCAPTPLQAAAAEAFGVDMQPIVSDYERRRDYALKRLREVTEVTQPGGAFYVFPKVPDRLRLTATQFVDRCVERKVLVVPGSAFSKRDTHIRISLSASMERLEQGLDAVCGLMRGE